jgi:p-hydroxybenzoate 3-monooxygenase
VDLLVEAGAGERLQREAIVRDSIELRFGGRRHRLNLRELSGGRAYTVYAQQEIVKDLVRTRLEAGGQILFDAAGVSVHDLDTGQPRIRFRREGEPVEIQCDFIAGCDGFHGVCRPSIPARALSVFERIYPFAWLGIVVDAAAPEQDLVYAYHERGFGFFNRRSPTVIRHFLQVAPDEDVANWPDDRIWDELRVRLATGDGWRLFEGPVVQKNITEMRSFVVEPLRYGRLYLAGDAAHIVPPTGAKGLNLAVADVRVLAPAFSAFFSAGRSDLLDAYSETCLKRIWRVEHFSWWMTSMLHRFPGDDAFQQRLQRSQLDYVVSSRAAGATLAENYVGLP